MPKVAYFEFDKEKLVKVKDLIIFLDDLMETNKLDNPSVRAIKDFFKRMEQS